MYAREFFVTLLYVHIFLSFVSKHVLCYLCSAIQSTLHFVMLLINMYISVYTVNLALFSSSVCNAPMCNAPREKTLDRG